MSKSDKAKAALVRGKLKIALDLMVFGGPDGIPLDWNEAARKADFSIQAMRKALERPSVRRYLKGQKQVLYEAIGGRIPARLAQLAHQDENRAAATKACQIIEQISDDRERQQSAGAPQQPGMFIVVLPASARPALSMSPPTQGGNIDEKPPLLLEK
jgi:hypothetical protein